MSPTTSPGPGFVDSETVAPGAAHDARLHGLTVRWQGAPFAAQMDVAHKRTSSDAVAGLRPSGTGLKVMAGWRYMPGGQISVIGVRAGQGPGGAHGRFCGARRRPQPVRWGFAWEHMITPKIQLLASAGVLRDAKGCTSVVAGAAGRGCKDTGATSYMVAGTLPVLQADRRLCLAEPGEQPRQWHAGLHGDGAQRRAQPQPGRGPPHHRAGDHS